MALEDFGKIVLAFQQYSVSIPLIAAVHILFKKRLSKNLIPLLILFVLFIPLELLSVHSSNLGNNLFYVSTARSIALLLYLSVFYLTTRNLLRKKVIIILGTIYFVILMFEVVFSPHDQYLQYANFLFNISLVIAAISCLLELVESDTHINITDHPMFWISAGILINNSILLVTLFVNNYLIEHDLMNALWISYIIRLSFDIVLYIFIAIGFWKSGANKSIDKLE